MLDRTRPKAHGASARTGAGQARLPDLSALQSNAKRGHCGDGSAGVIGPGPLTRSASTISGGSSFDGTAAGVKHPASISMITAISEASHVDDETQAGHRRRNSGSGIHRADGPHAERTGKGMGVQRKHVNELCNDRRAVTAPTALILARVFGNSPDFWLNVQRRSDIWEAMHSPRERERIRRARPIGAAAWCRCPAHHLKFGYEIPLYRTNLQSGAPDAIRPHG
jgi:antitoxin HigA-1